VSPFVSREPLHDLCFSEGELKVLMSEQIGAKGAVGLQLFPARAPPRLAEHTHLQVSQRKEPSVQHGMTDDKAAGPSNQLIAVLVTRRGRN
jgi:hypothetical protein